VSHELKHATSHYSIYCTKTKVAKVRAKPKTNGIADLKCISATLSGQ